MTGRGLARAAARLPVGPARAARPHGPRAPGRDRRPVGRDAGRPDARGRPGGAGGGGRRPGYPLTARHARRCARRSSAGWRAGAASTVDPARGAADGRQPRSSSPGCRRCSGSAPATRWWSRSSPIRRTTSARGSPAPRCVATDSTARARARAGVALVWLNSPSNPTGRVLPAEHLRKVVAWARERGAVVGQRRVLRRAAAGTPSRSRCCTPTSAAGRTTACSRCTRCPSAPTSRATGPAFVAGDPALVGELLAVRKHAGLMVPGPVQAAMAAALDDDEHVAEQQERYRARRTALLDAPASMPASGSTHSEAGLYLWATRDEPCWDTVGVAGRSWDPRGAGRLLRCGRRPPRPGRADRDRRADRRRRRPAHGLTRAVRRRARPARPRPRAGRCAAHLP